ncbi:MAG: hypothetical protein OJF48_000300 [Afipia sp.]|nr:MAG: hypothetical protein OJF48_000300 [Afipia sp.]
MTYGSQKRPRHPGDIIPEWWATSSRNGWATSNRNGGRDHLGMLGDIERNPQTQHQHRKLPSLRSTKRSGPPP